MFTLENSKLRPLKPFDCFHPGGVVTKLLEARQVKPQDAELKEDWNSLMSLVELEAIANQPLVSTFSVKPAPQIYTDSKPEKL